MTAPARKKPRAKAKARVWTAWAVVSTCDRLVVVTTYKPTDRELLAFSSGLTHRVRVEIRELPRRGKGAK